MQLAIAVKRPLIVWLVLFGFLQSGVQAQTQWPKQPIRIIVTFTPGGAPDILARVLAEQWQKNLNVPVLVENRPGVGGNIGADFVAKSEADGYTLLIGTVGIHAINGALYDKLSFDPIKDFTPISFLASTPNVLIVSKQLGITNLQELVELAKAKPNQLTFGSSGIGTSLHMSGELFKDMTGVQIRHIPYKGRAQSLPDLVSARITMLFDNLSSSLPLIKAGEVQALGVTSLKRSAQLPDIPSLHEAGVTNYDASVWLGLLAPVNTPKEIVFKLNAELAQVLNSADTQKALAQAGVVASPSSPEVMADLMASELARWGKIIKETGMKL